MTIRSKALFALSLLAVACSGSALAQKTTSGSANGLTWEARSNLVGVTPTGGAGGGDPRYFPTFPQYSGVVGLIMTYANGQSFSCTGTLLENRFSILTAAHCVSDGAGTANPVSTTVYFQPQGGLNQALQQNIYNPATPSVTRGVYRYDVHSGYTGEVIDQNDIAVLLMSDAAPEWATSYGLYTGALDDQRFNVAGYGLRSDIGGNAGRGDGSTAATNTGRLRQGDNRYDYRWGDAAFAGFFTDRDSTGENFFGTAEVEHSWVSDFDNGRATNDTSCRIALAVAGAAANNASYCDTGLGAMEVGVASGDSGGPNFINGRISAVNSYGLSFGGNFGDIRAGLNSSFGEFSGYVPVNIHTDFIAASMVSEPSALALGLLGLAGVAASRRRKA